MEMAAATVKDVQELPVVLSMGHVQAFLGLSKPKTYELAHTAGFPVVKFGRAIRVPRDKLVAWLNAQVHGQEDDDTQT
jgi:excisionase family DNA binding protein